MKKTTLCDLYGIEVPVILAPMGTCTSAELGAAVSNAGGLGGIGSLFRPFANVKRDIDLIKTLTKRSFQVSHIPQNLDKDAWRYTLEAAPKVISFALGDPGALIKEAHSVGSLVQVQVNTVEQALEAVEHGADVIVAQGGEAGGYSGSVGTLALVPQVVDAVAPVPVVAAGGIFDGRGLAAAFMLGASGVNLGTRFITAQESPASAEWKASILAGSAQEAKQYEILNKISPQPGTTGYKGVLRSLPTKFLEEWTLKPEEAEKERDRLRAEIVTTTAAGRQHECLLCAGQSTGGIAEILPVAEIMRRLVAETERALASMQLTKV